MARVHRSWTALALLVMFTLPLAADEEADHEALRQIRALYEKAINEDQLDLMRPHVAEPLYGVMITSKRVSSVDEMKQYWASMKKLMGPGSTYKVTVEPERSVFLGDFALARGTTADVVTTGDGKTYRFGTNWTAVLRRENGVWKLVQVQGSMDPVNNEFVRTFMREAITKSAAAAGVVGLIIGAVGGVLIGRRSAVRTAA